MIIIEPGNIQTFLTYDTQGASPLKNVLDWGLKVDVPGAQFLYAFKSGQWDGKVSLWEDYVDPASGKHTGVHIRTGLIPRLVSLLNQSGAEWQAGGDFRRLSVNYKLLEFVYLL